MKNGFKSTSIDKQKKHTTVIILQTDRGVFFWKKKQIFSNFKNKIHKKVTGLVTLLKTIKK
jgi:hypothetical protein